MYRITLLSDASGEQSDIAALSVPQPPRGPVPPGYLRETF